MAAARRLSGSRESEEWSPEDNNTNLTFVKSTVAMLRSLQRKHPEPRRADLKFFIPQIDNFNRWVHDEEDKDLEGMSLI